MTWLDTILQLLYTPKLNLITCSDINVNYLNDNDKKNELDAVLNSYNLFSMVKFPTRICNESISPINNIFDDIIMTDNFELFPLISELSDHDVQIIILNVLQNSYLV